MATGLVYLLHFDQPYHHAQHYIGYTTDNSHLAQRLTAHHRGTGARLMEVIHVAGIGFRLVRVWYGNRQLERRLKQQKNNRRLCPRCNPNHATHRGNFATNIYRKELELWISDLQQNPPTADPRPAIKLTWPPSA